MNLSIILVYLTAAKAAAAASSSCPPGFWPVNATHCAAIGTLNCPPGSTRSDPTGLCQWRGANGGSLCPVGFAKGIDGKCEKRTAPQRRCPRGFSLTNDGVTCERRTYTPALPVCPTNFTLNLPFGCTRLIEYPTSCTAGFTLLPDNSFCVKKVDRIPSECPINSSPWKKECAAIGAMPSELMCPADSREDNGRCSHFYVIPHSCPEGTIANATQPDTVYEENTADGILISRDLYCNEKVSKVSNCSADEKIVEIPDHSRESEDGTVFDKIVLHHALRGAHLECQKKILSKPKLVCPEDFTLDFLPMLTGGVEKEVCLRVKESTPLLECPLEELDHRSSFASKTDAAPCPITVEARPLLTCPHGFTFSPTTEGCVKPVYLRSLVNANYRGTSRRLADFAAETPSDAALPTSHEPQLEVVAETVDLAVIADSEPVEVEETDSPGNDAPSDIGNVPLESTYINTPIDMTSASFDSVVVPPLDNVTAPMLPLLPEPDNGELISEMAPGKGNSLATANLRPAELDAPAYPTNQPAELLQTFSADVPANVSAVAFDTSAKMSPLLTDALDDDRNTQPDANFTDGLDSVSTPATPFPIKQAVLPTTETPTADPTAATDNNTTVQTESPSEMRGPGPRNTDDAQVIGTTPNVRTTAPDDVDPLIPPAGSFLQPTSQPLSSNNSDDVPSPAPVAHEHSPSPSTPSSTPEPSLTVSPVYRCPAGTQERPKALQGEVTCWETRYVPARMNCPGGTLVAGKCLTMVEHQPQESCGKGTLHSTGFCEEIVSRVPDAVCPEANDRADPGEFTCDRLVAHRVLVARTNYTEPQRTCTEGSVRHGEECMQLYWSPKPMACPSGAHTFTTGQNESLPRSALDWHVGNDKDFKKALGKAFGTDFSFLDLIDAQDSGSYSDSVRLGEHDITTGSVTDENDVSLAERWYAPDEAPHTKELPSKVTDSVNFQLSVPVETAVTAGHPIPVEVSLYGVDLSLGTAGSNTSTEQERQVSRSGGIPSRSWRTTKRALRRILRAQFRRRLDTASGSFSAAESNAEQPLSCFMVQLPFTRPNEFATQEPRWACPDGKMTTEPMCASVEKAQSVPMCPEGILQGDSCVIVVQRGGTAVNSVCPHGTRFIASRRGESFCAAY